MSSQSHASAPCTATSRRNAPVVSSSNTRGAVAASRCASRTRPSCVRASPESSVDRRVLGPPELLHGRPVRQQRRDAGGIRPWACAWAVGRRPGALAPPPQPATTRRRCREPRPRHGAAALAASRSAALTPERAARAGPRRVPSSTNSASFVAPPAPGRDAHRQRRVEGGPAQGVVDGHPHRVAPGPGGDEQVAGAGGVDRVADVEAARPSPSRPSIDATAPSAPSETTTIGTRAPIIAAASSALPAPVSTSASRCSMNRPAHARRRRREAARERAGVVVADADVGARAGGHARRAG